MARRATDPAALADRCADVIQLMATLLDALELEQTEAGVWRAAHVPHGRGVAFGGQLLGQAIAAASKVQSEKRPKSVQSVFSRGVRVEEPVDIVAESLHAGRNFGTVSVRFVQGERVCASMLVLLDAAEPDLVRFQGPTMPSVAPPDAAAAVEHPLAAPETVIVDDVDIVDPALVGPAELQLWVRFRGAPADDESTARALLAHATDGWLIATAMRPHESLGQSMAHVKISTGVVTHSLSFHDHVDVHDWLLIDHATIFSGGGRTYGRGNVFTQSGDLVASFVQESLLRDFPHGQDPTGRAATIF